MAKSNVPTPRPRQPSAPADPVAHVAALIEAHMAREQHEDVNALVLALAELCESLSPDHGAEVVEHARATWLERTRTARLARYCPAEGYGGVQ